MVLTRNVCGVKGGCLYDVVVGVYGHDIDLVSVSVHCARNVRCYHCVIDVPGPGVDVEPDAQKTY